MTSFQNGGRQPCWMWFTVGPNGRPPAKCNWFISTCSNLQFRIVTFLYPVWHVGFRFAVPTTSAHNLGQMNTTLASLRYFRCDRQAYLLLYLTQSSTNRKKRWNKASWHSFKPILYTLYQHFDWANKLETWMPKIIHQITNCSVCLAV